MRPRDDNGELLIAEFSIEVVAGRLTLLLESAGGATGHDRHRNADYVPALRLLLGRLRHLNARIDDGWVDSLVTAGMPISDKRLGLRDRPYPVNLSTETDLDELRLAITNAQRAVGRRPGRRGGNNQKKIRLVLEVPGFGPEDAESLAAALAEPAWGSAAMAEPSEADRQPTAGAYRTGRTFQVIRVEGAHTVHTTYETGPRTVLVWRAESELVQSYLAWLGAGGVAAARTRSSAGVTDVFLEATAGAEIVEAKSDASHAHVRLALGQLLDYAAGTTVPLARLTALFPGPPDDTDLRLLHLYGIDCLIQSERGFVRLEAPDENRVHMQALWNSVQDP